MEQKFNEATPQRPDGDRVMDAQMVMMDIPLFIKQIKEEPSWHDSDRNAITVFKTNGLRIVLIALHKGAEMTRHTANGIINLQVLEGRLNFNTDTGQVQIKKGEMLALHKGIAHSVVAYDETVFLLTLTTSIQK